MVRTFKLVALICLMALVFSIPAFAGSGDDWDSWIVSIDGGWSMPMSDLDDSYDDGFNICGEVEYRFETNWTIDGFLQYRTFGDKSTAGDDLEIVNLNVDAKYYFLPEGDSFFARGGIGWYDPQESDDDADLGFNLGVGYLWLFDDDQPMEGVTVSVDFNQFSGTDYDPDWWDFNVGFQWVID